MLLWVESCNQLQGFISSLKVSVFYKYMYVCIWVFIVNIWMGSFQEDKRTCNMKDLYITFKFTVHGEIQFNQKQILF